MKIQVKLNEDGARALKAVKVGFFGSDRWLTGAMQKLKNSYAGREASEFESVELAIATDEIPSNEQLAQLLGFRKKGARFIVSVERVAQ